MSLEGKNEVSEEECRKKLKELVLQTQQIYLSEKKNNPLLNAVFQRMEEIGYDNTFLKIAQEHAKNLQNVISLNRQNYKNLKFSSPAECLSYYISKLFFDKLSLYQKCSCPVKINSDDPIRILPIQAFMKEDEEAKSKFEKTLKQYDVLYCEVLETASLQPSELVELRIIGKVNYNEMEKEFLYHLNSHVFMFKNLELTRLGRIEFSASEVLKVTVMGIKSSYTFVTTNIAALRIPADQKNCIVLGVVPSKKVPFDLDSFKIASNFQGYANYLRSQPTFYHSLNLKDEIASIGVDPHRIYSFCITRDGMTIPPNKMAASLYESAKVAMHAESPTYLAKAKKFVEEDDLLSAEEAFKDSLKSWPENYQVFEMRGKMYFDMCKKKFRRGKFLAKAMKDFETALELNPSASEPKKYLSKIFVNRTKRLVKNKEYDAAKKCLQTAVKLFPDYKEAKTMLKKIDRKTAYDVIEEDLDITTLEMRKKQLEKQLKKEIIK